MTRRRLRLAVIGPLFVAVVIILSFIIIVIIGVREGSRITQQRTMSSNRATLSVTAKLLFSPLYNLDVWEMNRTLGELPREETDIVYAGVRDTTGQIVTDIAEGWAPDNQVSRNLAAQALVEQGIVHDEIEGYLVMYGPITAGSEQIGTLEIAFDQAEMRALTGSMQRTMALLTIALVAGVVLTVAVLTRYTTSPLRELTIAAEEIGRGNLDVQVPVRGPEETAVLGTSLGRMRTDLQELYRNLEEQVADLERRASYMEATAEVARDAASMLDPQGLLSRVVALISERLGFYHTSIFLLDPTGEWAVLQAASSEEGQRMLAREYRLQVRPDSIVGYVAGRGEPRIALDTGADAMLSNRPDLSDTRSEVALPLRARGEIIGVLDVESTQPEAFSEEDVAVLQTLADQVATAISNARLFQQAQESLEAERRAYGEISRAGWVETLRTRPSLGYYCDTSGTVPVTEPPEAGGDEDLPEMSMPVTARGQVIGTISAHKPDDANAWTEEEIALVRTLVDQLSTALESARLYQDTQTRAVRERLTSEITDKMRRAVDIDTLMQTTIREMAAAVGASGAFVQLGVPSVSIGDEGEGDEWADDLVSGLSEE
jgi:GAF domain-containing protein/HAMP domain-containing protein